MYRMAPPGMPSVDDRLVEPGRGFRGTVLGGSTPQQVLAALGSDALLHPSDANADVAYINYDYDAADRYDPERNLDRPARFNFAHGLLESYELSVYQKALHTTGGIRIGTPRREVIATFGPDFDHYPHGPELEILRYLTVGIEFLISTDDDYGVTGMAVFRAQRLH